MSARTAAVAVLAAVFVSGFTPDAAAQVCRPVPAGAVSWLPGDGHAGDIVRATGPAPITKPDSTAFPQAKVGQGFGFDGITDPAILLEDGHMPFGDFSLEFWLSSAHWSPRRRDARR